MYPPSTGPSTGAESVVIDQMLSAVPRLCGGKIEISSAWLPGIIGPETAPCRMRKPISDGRSHARPHSSEAIVNANTDAVNVRTTPKRAISQPVSGTVTPLATANEVITQVPLSVETPRLPEIVGRETLAMVPSSTCMNVPSASATDATASAIPRRGGISAAGVLTGRPCCGR